MNRNSKTIILNGYITGMVDQLVLKSCITKLRSPLTNFAFFFSILLIAYSFVFESIPYLCSFYKSESDSA